MMAGWCCLYLHKDQAGADCDGGREGATSKAEILVEDGHNVDTKSSDRERSSSSKNKTRSRCGRRKRHSRSGTDRKDFRPTHARGRFPCMLSIGTQPVTVRAAPKMGPKGACNGIWGSMKSLCGCKDSTLVRPRRQGFVPHRAQICSARLEIGLRNPPSWSIAAPSRAASQAPFPPQQESNRLFVRETSVRVDG